MIGQIDALSRETNVASIIRKGGLGQVAASESGQGGTSSASTSAGSPADVHARLVEQGKKICETLGIPVRATYDANWRKAIGREFGKAVPAWQRSPSRPGWTVSRGASRMMTRIPDRSGLDADVLTLARKCCRNDSGGDRRWTLLPSKNLIRLGNEAKRGPRRA